MGKKINPDLLIAVELDRFEKKLKEFQSYLEKNSIVTQVTSKNEILLAEDTQEKLHKEIQVQIKMQDAVLAWLPLLKKLKESKQEDELQTRGDIAVNGLFKNSNNG